MSISDRGEAVGGLSYVRDGLDIVPLICGHYLRLGFSKLVFMDHNSVDGTYEFLHALSRRDPRVSVERVEVSDVEHGIELKSAVANKLIAEGIRIIFPFDQDEFWNLDLKAIRVLAQASPAGIFEGRFVQFIQDRNVEVFNILGWFKVRFRAPALASNSTAAVRSRKPYLCFSKQKVGLKSSDPIVLGPGNHTLNSGPTNYIDRHLEILHLPLRSQSEIRKRQRYQRFANWHIRKLTDANERDRFWESSSADREGCLTSETGEKIMLIPDGRLRAVLIKSFLYMAVRHPLILFPAVWRARNLEKFWKTPLPPEGPPLF